MADLGSSSKAKEFVIIHHSRLHTTVTLVPCNKWSMLKESFLQSFQLWHSWMPLLSFWVMTQSFLLRSTAPLLSLNEPQHTPFPDEWVESIPQVSIYQCQHTVSHQLTCVNEAQGLGEKALEYPDTTAWLWWSPAPRVSKESERDIHMLGKAHLRLFIEGSGWHRDDSLSAWWALPKPFRISGFVRFLIELTLVLLMACQYVSSFVQGRLWYCVWQLCDFLLKSTDVNLQCIT